ncbi:MAG: Na+/H+ antiporter NhaA [Sphingobacteriia bacterium]|nr:Na+/H+ antiporter NhaA [Sphingobacteriia bacterium]
MKLLTKAQINADSFSALLLFISLLSAFLISNSSLYPLYQELIDLKISIEVGELNLSKSLLKWVNDGLMAIFFFLLGLEMKYHLTDGEFKDKKTLLLPFIAAISGFIFPVGLYLLFNYKDQETIKGWAVPIATDTAFVLAILTLFKDRISNSAKVFIIGLSIIDDVLAVITLALFFTPNLNFLPLIYTIFPISFILLLAYFKVTEKSLYYISGIILWFLTIKAGVHGTIAGIVTALLIPTVIKEKGESKVYLVKEMEMSFHKFVAYFVLPLFAFVNSELPLKELSLNDFFSTITLGIFVGLIIGKSLGIYLSSYALIKMKICNLPDDTNYLQYFALSVAGGMGFTLSLFIGLQAFSSEPLINQMKLGVILASIVSALTTFIILKFDRKINLNK